MIMFKDVLMFLFTYLLKIILSGVGQIRQNPPFISLCSWCRRHRTHEAINKSVYMSGGVSTALYKEQQSRGVPFERRRSVKGYLMR